MIPWYYFYLISLLFFPSYSSEAILLRFRFRCCLVCLSSVTETIAWPLLMPKQTSAVVGFELPDCFFQPTNSTNSILLCVGRLLFQFVIHLLFLVLACLQVLLLRHNYCMCSRLCMLPERNLEKFCFFHLKFCLY